MRYREIIAEEFVDEAFGESPILYHGTSYEALIFIAQDNRFRTDLRDDGNGRGVSLTRSIEIAKSFGRQKEEYYQECFYSMNNPDAPVEFPQHGAVIVFDRVKLEQQCRIFHVDDGVGDEEEERTKGAIRPAFKSVTGILVDPADVARLEKLLQDFPEEIPGWQKVWPKLKGMFR